MCAESILVSDGNTRRLKRNKEEDKNIEFRTLKIGTNRNTELMFVHDIAIVKHNSLQYKLQIVTEELTKVNMNININKTNITKCKQNRTCGKVNRQ